VSNSIPVKKVRPRITMMVALSSRGEIYCSLLQANSDSDTMRLFMNELIIRLDREDKAWRRNTVLVWDGAGYHTSKETMAMLEDYQVPMLQLGAYGYLLNTPELLFAAFKSKKLNIDDVPVGKKVGHNITFSYRSIFTI
jgi:hypothetical protein